MSLGGSVTAMIASMRQNVGMLRTAHRKGLNKAILVRGSGTAKQRKQGRTFKSNAAREAFRESIAHDKRRAELQLRWIAVWCLLLILALLGWIIG